MFKKIANATNLKFLAITLMFLDHIYEMFVEMGAPIWLNMLGRLVFPLLLFLAADSFYYTHDRKAYLQRLLFMSWFMIIGNFTVSHFFANGNVGLANNAFGAFFLAGVSICAWDMMTEGVRDKKAANFFKGLILFLLPILFVIPSLFLMEIVLNEQVSPIMGQIISIFVLAIPNVLVVEGGYVMVYLGLLFYIFRQNRWAQIMILGVVSFGIYCLNPTGTQWMMVLAALPMYFYNGEKGVGMKRFFYIFYPVHLYFLYSWC